jgi:excisionase family DNA binding protein
MYQSRMVKDSNSKGSGRASPQGDSADLEKELRRQGMTDDEIEKSLRKKKLRKAVQSSLLKVRPAGEGAKAGATQYRAGSPRIGEELCTVDYAAEQLSLHPKTVLRFIHEGRLPATRLGKSFRILRRDLEVFAGLPARAVSPVEPTTATCIVDISGITVDDARRWARDLPTALNSNPSNGPPVRPEIVHDQDRSRLKVVLVGAPEAVGQLMKFVQLWTKDGSN